jgi:hypothetical protein
LPAAWELLDYFIARRKGAQRRQPSCADRCSIATRISAQGTAFVQ